MIVYDKMQQGYRYDYAAPEGEDFAADFKPELTPKQMLEMGVFEGHYLNDCYREFPREWYIDGKFSRHKPDPQINFFQVKSRMSLFEWNRRGWIVYPDPRGWFQWYCRYFLGRRLPEVDAWQIKRWKAFQRHVSQVRKNCLTFDFDCRAKQRQALLQWAYNPLF